MFEAIELIFMFVMFLLVLGIAGIKYPFLGAISFLLCLATILPQINVIAENSFVLSVSVMTMLISISCFLIGMKEL